MSVNMNTNEAYFKDALFEHQFWLQIIGDHARFIFDSLSPSEVEEVQKAHYFINTFDQLLEASRGVAGAAGVELGSLNQRAMQHSQEIRNFKLHLIARHLTGQIKISLAPTFLNHMVNEAEEYLRILCSLVAGNMPPPFNPIHYHLIWLVDAAGHAGAINDRLDAVEKRLKGKSADYAVHFEQFYIKAVELAGYMRTNLNEFPALSRFNKEVEVTMAMFTEFLCELEEMEIDAEVLGALAPLLLDHMAREECYYLTKLSEVSNVARPGCDPTKPRVEG
ncbi:MAG TPA: DUF2935 domain-containing protein [Bacilli bacterium]